MGTVMNRPLDKKGESVNPSTYVMQHCCCSISDSCFRCKPKTRNRKFINLRIGTDLFCQVIGSKNGKNQSLYQNKDADETEKIDYPINFMY